MSDLVIDEIDGKSLEITRINAGNIPYTEEAREFIRANNEP